MNTRHEFKLQKSWLEGCICTAPCAQCRDPGEDPNRKLVWDEPDWLAASGPAADLPVVDDRVVVH